MRHVGVIADGFCFLRASLEVHFLSILGIRVCFTTTHSYDIHILVTLIFTMYLEYPMLFSCFLALYVTQYSIFHIILLL